MAFVLMSLKGISGHYLCERQRLHNYEMFNRHVKLLHHHNHTECNVEMIRNKLDDSHCQQNIVWTL